MTFSESDHDVGLYPTTAHFDPVVLWCQTQISFRLRRGEHAWRVFEFPSLDVGEADPAKGANSSRHSGRSLEEDAVNQIGRPCSICNHRFKSEINRAIESGISISILSEKFEFSRSSGYRHVHHHLRPDPGVISLVEYAEVTTDLLERFAEIADDMRNIRRAAVATGNTANAVKAADQELKTLVVMSERMGVDDTRVQNVLSEFRAVSFASIRVMAKHEKVGQAILAQLELDGESEAQMSIKRVLRGRALAKAASETSDSAISK